MFSFLPSILLPNTKSKVSPEEVMASYVLDRDKKAIVSLYNEFADDMYHYVLTLSDPTLAKDIVQKTWLKVIEKPHYYSHAGSVKAWLFTIARNALIDEFRKTNRWVEWPDDEQSQCSRQISDTSPSCAEAGVDDQHLRTTFDSAIMALSFEQREAFCLQQEGFSLADIAHMTHAKQETIKTRLRYAKINLRKLLEQAND
jgi:RNA polymerase sigma-70 factor (ECF subfamily)